MKFRDFPQGSPLRHGHKIYPEDIAGLLGIPVVGDIFYVDPNSGSDTGNAGKSANDAYKTVTKAEDKMTSGANDVIVIAPTGGTGRTTETAAIAWDKRFAHIVGAAAPVYNSPRAGMNFSLAAATTTPQFVLSENGCIMKNIVFYQGVADSYSLVQVTGDYNYFAGVHINGMVNATAGDAATGVDLTITGADDNIFVGCTVGNDTTARSAANSNLVMASGSARNEFIDCRFIHWADNAGVLFGTFGASSIDRYVLFRSCLFNGGGANTGGTAQTIAFDTHAAPGGSIFLWDTWGYGFTDWADDFTAVESMGSMLVATAATAGLAQAVA